MAFSNSFKSKLLVEIGKYLTRVKLIDDGSSYELDDSVPSGDAKLVWWPTVAGSFTSMSNVKNVGVDGDSSDLLWRPETGDKPDTLVFSNDSLTAIYGLQSTGKGTLTEDDIIYIRDITISVSEV